MSLDKKIAQLLYEDDSMDVENFGDANERRKQLTEVIEVDNSKLRLATYKFDDDIKYLGKKIDRFDFLDPLNHVSDISNIESLTNNQPYLHSDIAYSSGNCKDDSSYEYNEGLNDVSLKDNMSSDNDSVDDDNDSYKNIINSSKQHQLNNDSMSKSNDEIKRGKENREAIPSQFELYDSLLSCRMLEQEMLMEANKLPDPINFNQIIASYGQEYNQKFLRTKRNVQILLRELLSLQQILLEIYEKTNASSNSDEEITSEEEEEESNEQHRQISIRLNDIETTLRLRHANFERLRNNILLEAFNRVHSFTSISNKNINSSSNILTQIKQIMLDKSRLIDRTRVHRSMCKILGKNEETQDLHSANPQIFDDGDFYHQLLVEMTKRKTSSLKDMMAISRHWSDIGKLKKMRKNVDPKASKGRRTRYTIHKKLVNFMPPLPSCHLWSDNQRDGLFQELFKNEKLNETSINWMFQ